MNRDYKLGAIAGFVTGLCLIPTALNSQYHHVGILVALPVIASVGIMFGIWLGKFLSGMLPVMFQLSKFAAVGILNTAINFGVLNILSLFTGITAGLSVGTYNIPATAIAATNSYFWNKYWVFNGVSRGSISDIPKFIIVTTIGLVVRSGIIVWMTTYVSHGVSNGVWLNVANVVATLAGILVDYLGYKFLVFRSNKPAQRF